MINSRRCFVFVGILAAASSMLRAQSYRVVGYYPMWNRATLPASAVRYGALTHINHAFAWPKTDGGIALADPLVDTALINSTHRAGRKILLSFGGAGATQASNFSIVLADSALRRTFLNNVVAHLGTYHYDGFDIDWEGSANRADKANEVIFVQELRAAFDTVDPSLLITMAIGPSNWSGQWHDYTALDSIIDWFNAMEYDYHGSWSAVAGHNAPLYAGSDPITDPDYFSIDQSIQYLCGTRGIPASKITLGLPFYGKSFGTSSLYTTYIGAQELAYRDIVAAIASGGGATFWDAGSMVPYYASASPPRFITYDDSASITLKCQYAKAKGLSGVMIWELSQDVIGRQQPLLDAVEAQMNATSGIVAENLESVPGGFTLYNNYPNPFNPTTTIGFRLTAVSVVTLKVFDVLGKEVLTLVDEVRSPGVHAVQWNGSSSPSGVYLYRLSVVPSAQQEVISTKGRKEQTHIGVSTKKMLLIQ